MNDQFKVGTICIYQNVYGPFAYKNGMECEITGSLAERWQHFEGFSGYALCYLARDSEGDFSVLPQFLRRKPPKQSDSQWADEAIRKLKKQSSDHVAIGKPELIPEEAL